jgi:Flp pilus assembly protein TadG
MRVPAWVRCEAASAVVEFGIVGPLVLMILLGVIEFGRLHWVRNSMEYAAEQTARWAIVNTTATDDQLKAHAKAQLGSISASAPEVEIERDTVGGLTFVTVVVLYNFQFLADFADIGSIALRSETRVPLI